MAINTNAVADEFLSILSNYHARVYRNHEPQNPTFPYIVFRAESVTDTYPSEDFYLNINYYDDEQASSRAIETLADTIDNAINRKVINEATMNLHIEREQRQHVPANELVGKQMVNVRYVVRIYFK